MQCCHSIQQNRHSTIGFIGPQRLPYSRAVYTDNVNQRCPWMRFFMTRPKPTHHKLENLDPIPPNVGLYRVPVNKYHKITRVSLGRQSVCNLSLHVYNIHVILTKIWHLTQWTQPTDSSSSHFSQENVTQLCLLWWTFIQTKPYYFLNLVCTCFPI